MAHLINGASFGELALMQVGEQLTPACLLTPQLMAAVLPRNMDPQQ